MVKEAAEDAMKQTGFVYESTSGLYYDYNTGYYYNAVRWKSGCIMYHWYNYVCIRHGMHSFQELGLYYDGNSGCYYYYDKMKNVFEFHSRVNFPECGESTTNADLENFKCESKRKKNRKTKVSRRIGVIASFAQRFHKIRLYYRH